MKGLNIVAAVTMAGVSSVFALLAEIEDRYELATASLGRIAGSAFLSALITQLSFARRAIVVAADGNQGELLGTFYAAYLSGSVFGPPVAGALTELSDVPMPFLVLGLCTAASLVSVARLQIPAAQEPAAEVDKRVLSRLVRSPKVVAAILVVMSFRYSIGVFEPLWAPYLDDLGASTTLITLSLTGFALPMLVVARPAGRLSDRFGPRLTSLPSAAAIGAMTAAPSSTGSAPDRRGSSPAS
ncbi:MAG: MFS transporter [Actinomycetia bacterium]|nr:MFS transporter [Actinomycetes bacterium]